MKIGIDARLLTEPITGIGRYTFEMCKQLVKTHHSIYLYVPNKIPDSHLRALFPAKIRSSNAANKLQKLIWSQTTLAKWAQLDDVDIFWGATHRLPMNLKSEIPRVVTVHDLVLKLAGQTMKPLSRRIESLLLPQAMNSADLIMVDSSSTGKDITNFYPRFSSKIRKVSLGVTDFLIQPNKQDLEKLNISKPYFIFVGTLEPRKNLKRLLEAYSQLSSDTIKKYDFVIVGGKGWGGENIKQLVKSLGLDHHVKVLGYINDESLVSLYRYARFLAIPSLYEGFGLPILEAMSFGTPVLTSNISSMPEVAGSAAELVDPLSIDSIKSGLEKMLSDDELVSRLSNFTASNIEKFTWENAAHRALEIFSEAIKSKEIIQKIP